MERPGASVESFLAASGVAIDLPVASPASRALAAAVDQLLLFALSLLLLVVGGGVAVLLPEGDARLWLMVGGLLLLFLVRGGYFVAFELAWHGQTPGKRLFGLRVVTVDGGVPGFWPVTIRNLVRAVDALPGSYGFGVVAALLSARGQRLGDLAAGTVVVREPPAREPWHPPEGFDGELARLLEDWFRRAPLLLPERREALAAELVMLVEARRPGTFAPPPTEKHAAALYWRFHPEAG